jgi:hypothetical protein
MGLFLRFLLPLLSSKKSLFNISFFLNDFKGTKFSTLKKKYRKKSLKPNKIILFKMSSEFGVQSSGFKIQSSEPACRQTGSKLRVQSLPVGRQVQSSKFVFCSTISRQ